MENGRTVHVIDDEMAMRRSMRYALKTAGYDVQDWGSGDEFVKAARSVRQGCVLLDYRMPGLDALEVQRELTERGVAMPVIVMTGHGDISVAVSAMKGGAIDFLEKPFERAQLLAAVNAAFEEIDRSHAADVRASNAEHILRVLTPRELEVLEGLAQGLPNKSIAHDLGISRRTVEVHRANLMTKLAVHSFSDALRIAFAAGLGRKTRSAVP